MMHKAKRIFLISIFVFVLNACGPDHSESELEEGENLSVKDKRRVELSIGGLDTRSCGFDSDGEELECVVPFYLAIRTTQELRYVDGSAEVRDDFLDQLFGADSLNVMSQDDCGSFEMTVFSVSGSSFSSQTVVEELLTKLVFDVEAIAPSTGALVQIIKSSAPILSCTASEEIIGAIDNIVILRNV